MAYYEITRRCGHVDEVNIKGTNTRGERERRAAYLARDECFACQRAARHAAYAVLAERAAAIAAEQGWPALTGSESQVRWAQDIRMTAMAALAEQVTDEAVLATLSSALLRSTTAKWWIERRGLALPIRQRRDLVEEPGVARYSYGSLIDAAITLLTDAEREAAGLRINPPPAMRPDPTPAAPTPIAAQPVRAPARTEPETCRHNVSFADDCAACEF